MDNYDRIARHGLVVGITGNYSNETCTLAEGYYQSVLKAGCVPVIIPPFFDTDRLCDLLDRLDGIVFSGGGDIDPLLLGEEPIPQLHGVTPERDRQELLLARMAYDRQMPMLGICKGIQVINAALGGTLYQDIGTQMEGLSVKHSQDLDRRYPSHTVNVVPDSTLYKIFRGAHAPAHALGVIPIRMGDFGECVGSRVGWLAVNSFHHQACREVAPCLRVSATSADGVIEAVESAEYKSVIGVQWHPETPILRHSDEMMPLFRWLADECREYAAAKRVHSRVITLDSHCDTPMLFEKGDHAPAHAGAHALPEVPHPDGNNTRRVGWGVGSQVDLHKMCEGRLDSTVMVAYLPQGERDEASLARATESANQILTQIEDFAAAHSEVVEIARTPDDVARLKDEGKKAIMLGVENGYAVGRDLRNVEAFRRRGVVYMTLCHNGDNDICDSAKGEGEHGGVSPFGAEVIAEMNRVGMMVDLSHASEASFYDAMRLSRTPIVCSHSSARALCDHPRNLTDVQLRALAQSGGVAQVTLYHAFLVKDSRPDEATILDAVAHLDHMVRVMGVEHVGIGTDFDGGGGVRGLASASELINFTRQLLRRRYTEEQIRMIWGGNFLRLMRDVQMV